MASATVHAASCGERRCDQRTNVDSANTEATPVARKARPVTIGSERTGTLCEEMHERQVGSWPTIWARRSPNETREQESRP